MPIAYFANSAKILELEAELSYASAILYKVLSSNGLPINCKPTGIPSLNPHGTLIDGSPVRFDKWVALPIISSLVSLREYSTPLMLTTSASIFIAGSGAVGVAIASTLEKASAKPSLIKRCSL